MYTRLTAILALFALMLAIAACTEIGPDSATTSPSEEAAATAVPSEEDATDENIRLAMINLNDMTEEQLTDTIPDIGSNMIHEFFEYQPYVSIQQFRRDMLKYVDADQVAFYEDYVFVPVNVNDSDAETLMQIPGVDLSLADTLMAARPFASNDAFMQALAEHLSADEVEEASPFLEQ